MTLDATITNVIERIFCAMLQIRSFLKKILPNIIIRCFKRTMYIFFRGCFLFDVYRRRYTSIFNVDVLCKEMNYITPEYGLNGFYGHYRVMKKIFDVPAWTILNASIEHGSYFNDYLEEIEIRPKVIFTMSEMRRSLLMEKLKNKIVISVGPYIQYVNDIYKPKKMKSIKRMLGKTLLVFPSHSSNDIEVSYDIEEFIKEINTIANENNFSTVLVCVYWRDYLDGNCKAFLDEGYKLCSAGHAYDSFFLDRLKTIINLSDVVMANKFGTHMGYVVSMGKPYYLYKQRSREMRIYTDDGKIEYDEDVEWIRLFEKEALDLFGIYSEVLNEKQLKFIRKYWGNWN